MDFNSTQDLGVGTHFTSFITAKPFFRHERQKEEEGTQNEKNLDSHIFEV